jgi:hypothetical protein
MAWGSGKQQMLWMRDTFERNLKAPAIFNWIPFGQKLLYPNSAEEGERR